MLERTEYLKRLIAFRDQKIIKVVTGVRRCGKSTLLALYRDYLISTGVEKAQIISINLEDMEYEALLDYKVLYNFVKDKLCENKSTYVFIDEVQNCKSFEKVVNSLFIKDNVDVYITGSNAYMLSGELATLLSGRYITIDMLPLSFKEYCQAVPASNSSEREKFNDYLRFGSFPYAALLEQNTAKIMPYLEGIYNTILIKDVAMRDGITDVSVLESIVKTLASGIGSPISINKIADTIQSSGRKISVNTVDAYVRALTDGYIFYKVDRYDIKGRQHLKTLGKYYIVDSGIRQMLLSQGSADLGHLIENTVYLELRRRGFKVNVGKLELKEVDFVASGPEGLEYYQVAASVLDEKTLQRELEPLEKIGDHFPKVLLTLDDIGSGVNYNGIRHVNLLKWLLDSPLA
ncbi:ATP-binding protein [Acidaminobacter sp.]|uniref:ATP-binding protein n=1 Tax=Acidaminobacter sp. TaxID=1872102 RepID=UPI00255F56FA|nr:ATP-binding protein [Acidaminobacter sp.]MDK9711920.1 ATP-binding protein [Acidaminobacter sp.]